jgi:hypothetical protein
MMVCGVSHVDPPVPPVPPVAPASGPVPEAPDDPPVAEVPDDPPVAEVPDDPPDAEVPDDPPVAEVPDDPPVAEVPDDPPDAEVPDDPPDALPALPPRSPLPSLSSLQPEFPAKAITVAVASPVLRNSRRLDSMCPCLRLCPAVRTPSTIFLAMQEGHVSGQAPAMRASACASRSFDRQTEGRCQDDAQASARVSPAAFAVQAISKHFLHDHFALISLGFLLTGARRRR